MTKYKVNGGDRSERGDKVISLEAKRKPTGNKGKHIEGQRTETSGSARKRDWVVGSQILTGGNRGSRGFMDKNTLTMGKPRYFSIFILPHSSSL